MKTVTEAQLTLLGILSTVESGAITPEEAVEELGTLKSQVAEAGLTFSADYTVEDFEKIRTAYASTYESSSSSY